MPLGCHHRRFVEQYDTGTTLINNHGRIWYDVVVLPLSLRSCLCGNIHQISGCAKIEGRSKAARTSSCGVFKQVGIHCLCRQLNVAHYRSTNKTILHRHLVCKISEMAESQIIDRWNCLTMCGCLASSNTVIESSRMLRNLMITYV